MINELPRIQIRMYVISKKGVGRSSIENARSAASSQAACIL